MSLTVQLGDNSSPRRTIQFKASSSSPRSSTTITKKQHNNTNSSSKGTKANTQFASPLPTTRRMMPVNTFMSPAAIAMEALLARMDAEEEDNANDDGTTPTFKNNNNNTTPAAHPVTPQMGPTPINIPTSKSNSTASKMSVAVSKRILYNNAEEDEMDEGNMGIVHGDEPIVMVTQEVNRSAAVDVSSGWRQSKRSSKGGGSSNSSTAAAASSRPNQQQVAEAKDTLDRVTKELQLWASSNSRPVYFKPRSTPPPQNENENSTAESTIPVPEDNTAPDAQCDTVAPTRAPIPTTGASATADDTTAEISHSPLRECSPVADAAPPSQHVNLEVVATTTAVEEDDGDQDEAKLLAAALAMSESSDPPRVVAESLDAKSSTLLTTPPARTNTVAEVSEDVLQDREMAAVLARTTSQPIDDALGSILEGNVGEVFPIICYNGIHVGSLNPSHADTVHTRIEESTGDKLRRPLNVEEFHIYLYVLPVQGAVWLGDSSDSSSSSSTATTKTGILYDVPHIDTLLQVLCSPHCRKVLLDGQGFLYPLLLALVGPEGLDGIVNVVDLRVAEYVLPESYTQHQSSSQRHPQTNSTTSSLTSTSYAVPGSVEWIVRGVESDIIQPLRNLYAFIGTSYCVPVENTEDRLTNTAEEVAVVSPSAATPQSRHEQQPFGPQAQLFTNLLQESSVAYCCALMEYNGLVLNAQEAIQTLQLLQQRSNAIHTLIDEIISAARMECGLMVSSSSSPVAASSPRRSGGVATTANNTVADKSPSSSPMSRRSAAAGDSSEESRQYLLSRRRLHTAEDRVHAILAMPSSLISNTPATLSTPLLQQQPQQDDASFTTSTEVVELLPRHQLSLSPQDNLLLTQQTHEYGGARQYIISLLSAMAPTVDTEISSIFRAQLRTDSVLLWHCPVAALWAELCEVKDAGSKLQQLLKKHQGRIAAKMELARSGVVSSNDDNDKPNNNLLIDLHPTYNADSSTGRIFSSNPNVQTIPTAEYLIGTTIGHTEEGDGAAATSNSNDSCSFTPGQIALLNRVWREIKEKRKSTSSRAVATAAASAAETDSNIIEVDEDDNSTKLTSTQKTRRIQVVEEENVVVVSGKATIFRASQSQDDTNNTTTSSPSSSSSPSSINNTSAVSEGMHLSEIPTMLHPQRVSVKGFYRGCCSHLNHTNHQKHDQSVIISLDYNQIELRMLAHHSQDSNLLRAFTSTPATATTTNAPSATTTATAEEADDNEEVPTTPTPLSSKKGSKKKAKKKTPAKQKKDTSSEVDMKGPTLAPQGDTNTATTSTDKSVSDVLRFMASLMFGLPSPDAVTPQQRQAAKVVTYGLMYGLGDAALQARLPTSLSSPTSTPSTTQQSVVDTTPPPRPSSGSEQVPIEKLCPAHLLDELTQEGPSATTTTSAPALPTTPDAASDAPAEKSDNHPANDSEAVVVTLDAPSNLSLPPLPSHQQRQQPVTAASVRAAFRSAFPQACAYLEHLASTAVVTGEVRTLGGRRRQFERPADIASVGGLHGGSKRPRGDEGGATAWSIGTKAVATVIQGSAADVLKGAMVACVRAIHASNTLRGRCRLVSSIHDELLFTLHLSHTADNGNGSEVEGDDVLLHSAIRVLRECMEQQATHFHLSIPLTVSTKVGPSLGSLNKKLQHDDE